MTAKNTTVAVPDDVEALSPESDVITLTSGFVVRVEHLKTRGMFKLLKIITRGAGPILMQMDLDFNDQDAFMAQLMAVMFMAIPEAESEAIEFLQAIVVPDGYFENPKTEEQKEANKELFQRLAEELDDPEIEDTFSIVEKVITNEAHDIQALGKRLAAVLKVQTNSLVAKN